MRIGSIGYTTHQGLGILLKDFYDNGIITDVITVEHWKYLNHYWYRGPIIHRGQTVQTRYLEGLDLMFFFETCFSPHLINFCKTLKIPMILMPMYECTPDWVIRSVDKIINPSLLDQRYFPQGKFLPVPVPDYVPWKKRKKARVFVHNTGHGGLNGRNGTKELLKAMKHVKSPIKLIVRSQEIIQIPDDPRIELRVGTFDQEELYDEGDVFIFPEKFNGLSLPLQEAFAAGMLVMACDRFPMNTWLPKHPLIPTQGTNQTGENLAREVPVTKVTALDIANTIDIWYGEDISNYSKLGAMFKQVQSWERLKDSYLNEIKLLLDKRS